MAISHLVIFETCFIPFVRRRKLFFGTYSPITSLSCGLTVVAMPKNAILSTVAAAAMAAMLAAAAAFFCFEIRNGKNGIRWFAARRASADGRTDGRSEWDSSCPVRPFVRLFPMQPTDQPFISGKKSRFLLTADAPCAVCERLKPETGGRSERAEVQWAKLEFSNGLNAERRSCRFFVPAQLRFRLIGSRRGKRATGRI